ncbi:MAG: tetratricopeptide repeat protein [Pyrinomonadaceae bacterium]
MRNLYILTAIAIFATVTAIAQDESRASATWHVQRYDISVALPQSENGRVITAKATLKLKNSSAAPAATLSMRISPSAEVTATAINGSPAEHSKREEKINAGNSLTRIVIRIPPVPSGGELTAIVDYKLTIKDNSGLGAVSPIGSQMLPLAFWYPTPNSWYFARGADYAPFRIEVQHSDASVLVSSGKALVGSYEQKLNGQPFFVVGSWDVVNSNDVAVFLPKGVSAEERKIATDLAVLSADAKAFAATFLGPAPDVPTRIVAVKRGAGFSGGGTTLVDDGVFHRNHIDSLTAMTIAESSAKLWLGNSVAVSDDGSGVITEGLSRYIATQFIESKYGKDVADVERLRQRNAYSAVAKRDSALSVVSPLDDYYYAEVANKGAMIWRILSQRVGTERFFNSVQANMKDSNLNLAELRESFSEQKEILDHFFDQVTDTNLLVGIPQQKGVETVVALRNTGRVDATVTLTADASNGEKFSAVTTIRANTFGEVAFKTTKKLIRVEIDSEKLYPQIDYSDDVAPREFTDSDRLLAVKRSFDKQDFSGAEKSARSVLRDLPRFDDVRVLLGRALLGQGKYPDAEREFQAILAEKLPTARSIAWANEGLAEVAAKLGDSAAALRFAGAAIRADGDFGASLAARSLRTKLNPLPAIDETVKSFFLQFDKAAASNRKADIDSMVVSGEVSRFAGGISGSTEQWQTHVTYVDKIDASTILVEANMAIKLLNKEQETGPAVYRLVKVGNNWKLSAVEVFEVR